MSKIIVCKSCNKEKPHNAKGLCNTCYRRLLLKTNEEYRLKQQKLSASWQKINNEKVNAYGRVAYRKLRQRILRRQRFIIDKMQEYDLDAESLNCLFDRGCAICGDKEKDLRFDHDHKTGQFRGLLCNNHNVGIGLLGDTAESVYKAYRYLEQHETGTL